MPYFRKLSFASTLVGIFIMCINGKQFEILFPFNVCFSSFPIRMCMSTPNSKHVVGFFSIMKITKPKGRALMQMYRVVPLTKKRELRESQ